MIGIALRMLFGDGARYATLVGGICFATVLMTQGMALFFGLMTFHYSIATNIRAPIWVVDPLVQHVSDFQPLRDVEVHRVRSVPGVAWAAPLHIGNTQARLGPVARPVTLVGLDATTLAGAPNHFLSGTIHDLRRNEAVVVEQRLLATLAPDGAPPLTLGDAFEMNDRRAVIVGVVDVAPGIGGGSYVFTTFDRVREYVPAQRKMLTHVLAAPEPQHDPAEIASRITAGTGLNAMTEGEFKRRTERWMLVNSPIPFVVGVIVGIGFLVGAGISGQTYYSFILDNSRHLGALKAMGTTDTRLAGMVIAQAAVVGFTGFGLGLGLLSSLLSLLPAGKVPLVLLWPVPVVVLAAVLLICTGAALAGVWRIQRIEPALVFRA
jgi:putative ABC transport system permease protein